MRSCTRCDGKGKSTYDASRDCYSCKGSGQFPDLDVRAIVAAVKGKKGLRSARPKDVRTVESDRAYYVWRLARFHSGDDMRMPVMADLGVTGDPFKSELDDLAEAVARVACGTDLAATRAWGRALTGREIPAHVRCSKPTIYDSIARSVLFPGESRAVSDSLHNFAACIGNVGDFLSRQTQLF